MSQEPTVRNPRLSSLDVRGDCSFDKVENVVHVSDSSDLPPVQNGRHQLQPQTGYLFNGFITSQYGLELATQTPLAGFHGSLDGFIHTGGDAAVYGRNVGYFAQDLYIHAPGGTVYDLSGTTQNEILVNEVNHNDAAMLGNISDMGTIDGYRVPSFEKTNFGDFNSGITFSGTSEKILFSSCPFRSVDDDNVTCFTFNGTTEIISFVGNYVTGVQSDTEVMRVTNADDVNGIIQYSATTHGADVTESNILVGDISVDRVGMRVSDSFPLADSRGFVGYTLDSNTTTTINSQAGSKTDEAAYERIAGTTTPSASSRFDTADNEATFRGKRTRVVSLEANVSMATGNSDQVAVAWFQSGNIIDQTIIRRQMEQQGGSVASSTTSSGVSASVDTDDTFDVRIANLDSTTDVTVGELNAKLLA